MLLLEEGDARTAARALLRRLLETGVVDALLVPARTPEGGMVAPALVADAGRLEGADPWAPVALVNSARLVCSLSVRDPGRRVGVVLRPCEIRALVELVKLKQATLEPLLILGTDCLGTYTPADYGRLVQESGADDLTAPLLRAAPSGQLAPADGYCYRRACEICEFPSPHYADVTLGVIGLEGEGQILIQAGTARGEEALARAGVAGVEAATGARQRVLARLVGERTRVRDEAFARFRKSAAGGKGLFSLLASCIGCHNCSTACPVCYCKECLFRSSSLEYAPAQYLQVASRRGALRMPRDVATYHLTRLNHMVTSCVGCGHCEQACPSGIALTTLFRSVAQRTQALFGYEAGRSVGDELPQSTFREDELEPR